ncbi:copper chaperone CopZ [Niallia sp. NCCP-28]|uniref:copper chaperone CopZ n=1 Tax=Niallia sp. NCCP-28 TaxID=2934712 RepID=UPI0020863A32|nr:copper chaperone CopZ [Niallia sp. NCCP-28]GKU83271.1 copper chaperone CopZ [Niallia sp. NCCP-28]
MEKITLKVEGMSCGHCVKAVESSVGELAGVKAVKVNLENGFVDVEFNEKELSVESIKETIDDQGYDVK